MEYEREIDINKSEFLKALGLSENSIILDLPQSYINKVCDFDMNGETNRMLGYAAEKKLLEILGPKYSEGEKFKYDYMFTTSTKSKYPIELKISFNGNYTFSEMEWSKHHITINPICLFAKLKHISDDQYKLKIINIILFSDFANILEDSQFNNSKFLRINKVNAFE